MLKMKLSISNHHSPSIFPSILSTAPEHPPLNGYYEWMKISHRVSELVHVLVPVHDVMIQTKSKVIVFSILSNAQFARLQIEIWGWPWGKSNDWLIPYHVIPTSKRISVILLFVFDGSGVSIVCGVFMFVVDVVVPYLLSTRSMMLACCGHAQYKYQVPVHFQHTGR